MARIKAKKKSTGKKPAQVTKGRAKLLLPRTRVLVALIVVALLGWGMQSLWKQVAPSVIQRNQHLLQAERITSTSLPAWISADVCTEVVRNAGLDGRLSLLDDAFSQVIEDAFVLHPWVDSVEQITKQYPQGVHVELTYRRPVAVVEMSGREGVLFVPVDRQGVHLPTDDVPELRKRYLPRIGGIVGRPPVGQKWPDPRVIGGAELAEKLREQWEPLCLVDILPSARPEVRDGSRFFVYDLITRGGTRIVWGAAPGTAPPKEDPFNDKLTRLQNCVEKHGPLDSVRGPAIVRVRSALEVIPRTVKKPSAAGKDPRTAKTPPDDDAPVIQ